MNRQRILGAIAFPSFVLAWTAGTVLLMLQFQPAGAVERWTPAWERGGAAPGWQTAAVLPAAPSFDDPGAWRQAIGELAARSEVMNGSWQPQPAQIEETPAAETAAAETAAAETAVAEAVVAEAPAAETPVAETPAVETAVAEARETRRPDPARRAIGARKVEPSPAPPAPDTDVAANVDVPASRATADSVIRKTAAQSSPRLTADKAQARRALRAGRFAEAYGRLRPSVAEARNDTEYLGLLALAAMRTGSNGEAMVLYQRLAGMEPDTGRWRVGLALAQERLGMDASSEYRQALALSDPSADLGALVKARLSGSEPPGIS